MKPNGEENLMAFLTDSITTTSQVLRCCECGFLFAVPAGWYQDRRNDHEMWWCPNGHKQHFSGKNEAEKLREQLEREQRCCESNRARAAHLTEQVEHREAQIRGYRGHLAKLKKRSATT